MTDLTVCQDCQKEPAVYGDGLTWSRCASCQYKIIPGLTSIIMPVYINNYSLFHYTGNAIGSIKEHTKKEDYEFIVIDNASSIKPPNQEAYYADKVIVNETNEGVTKAWNKGIRCSSGEYIVLINNDVQVFNGWLTTLKSVLDSGEADLVMAHPMYSLTEPFARAVESNAVIEGTKKFDQLSRDFSCVMFKKSLVDELGLFDEDFFNYCSDLEFFDRMDQEGKKYIMCDKVATHHISDATGSAIQETSEIMNKDKETYERKRQEGKKMIHTRTDLVRTKEAGDKLFFIKENKTHWVINPEVLHALGLELGQETNLTKDEFNRYTQGEEVNMQNVNEFKND